MITESKDTEIFCIADDFCKEFETEMAKNALPSIPDASDTVTAIVTRLLSPLP